MATDPRDEAKVYIFGLRHFHADDLDLRDAADFIERQDATIAALREKLEAAEARIGGLQAAHNTMAMETAAAKAALAEARAAQAAAWEAGRDAAADQCADVSHEIAIRALTPPADLSAALQRVRDEAWEPIETAPYGEVVTVRAGSMTFRAVLCMDASMNDDEEACDQWQADVEGEHPPCWSGGACWESNEDEVVSLQPDAWRALRRAPTEGEG